MKASRIILSLSILMALVAGILFGLPAIHAEGNSLPCHKSDSMIYKGISLYKDGKFEEAVPYFETAYNDTTYQSGRYQMWVYSSMWLANALRKSGHPEMMEEYGVENYSFWPPLDPRDMEKIDSLSFLAWHAASEDLTKAISILTERQKLLESIAGPDHYWALAGREYLIDMICENFGQQSKKLTFANISDYYADARTVAGVVDSLANLSVVALDRMKADSDPGILYYYVQSLGNIAYRVAYMGIPNYYTGVVPAMAMRLVEVKDEYPQLFRDNPSYLLGIARINLLMGSISDIEETAPTPVYSIDREKYLKAALDMGDELEKATEGLPLTLDQRLEVLHLMQDACRRLVINYPEKTGEHNSVDDFDYYFYQLAQSPDSVAMREHEKINEAGIWAMLGNTVVEAALNNGLVMDRNFEQLSDNEKKLVNLWNREAELLKANDTDRYLQFISYDVSAYSTCKLYRPLVNIKQEAYELCRENGKPLMQLQVLYDIADLCSDLSGPLTNDLERFAQTTMTRADMGDYMKLYQRTIEKFNSDYDSIINLNKDFSRLENANLANLNRKMALLDAYKRQAIAKKVDSRAYYLQAIESIQKYLDLDSEPIADKEWLERNLAEFQVLTGGKESFTKVDSLQTAAFKGQLNTFRYASSDQRRTVWNQFIPHIEDNLKLAFDAPEQPGAGNLAYNSLLYRKGILLASDRNFISQLTQAEIADTAFCSKRVEYLRLQAQGNEQRRLQALERELLPYLRWKDINRNLDADWQNVREALRKGEAAVEFGQLSGLGEDETLYGVVLIPGKLPQIVKIGGDMDISQLDSMFTRTINDKLEPLLEGARRVYFAPDGVLYKMPIEHFAPSGREWIRVSSTRQIAERGEDSRESPVSNIALFGGLDYGKATDNSEVSDSVRGLLPSVIKHGVSELSFTLQEVQEISDIATHKGLKCRTYTGPQGGEKTLRSVIAGGETDALHLSTHGFYYSDNDLRRIQEGGNKYYSDAEKETMSMQRCGLLLSGSNPNLIKGTETNNPEDGVLNASEVEGMDMSCVKFLGLSACQTGLGDISADGVFGLQRGFKKAGVGTILMSLWKVNDRATQLLMGSFYENLLSGCSCHQSLAGAQAVVRNYTEPDKVSGLETRPFDSPRYWAAFILLDALD